MFINIRALRLCSTEWNSSLRVRVLSTTSLIIADTERSKQIWLNFQVNNPTFSAIIMALIECALVHVYVVVIGLSGVQCDL